jgi:hypothetical protein
MIAVRWTGFERRGPFVLIRITYQDKMAIEIAGNGSDIHKWAALEKTQVFPVRPIISLRLR